MKYKLLKPFLVQIILKGLPSNFNYFTLYKYEELTKDIDKLDILKLLSKLISKEARINSNIELRTNKTTKYKNNKLPYYKYYNKQDHLESKYSIKYPKLYNKSKDTIKDKNTQ